MSGRILVIADDFTGAAEIAGIGSRFSQSPEIIRRAPFDSTAPMMVIDTDSRSLPPAQAAQRVKETLDGIAVHGFDLIFKKIDSLLRGPIIAEIDAALRSLGRPGAILAPANPSHGRTITDGEYRIDRTPLHETSLASDPEYPRRTSNVEKLIGPISPQLTVANAANEQDVREWAAKVNPETLPVGAADFFTAILTNWGLKPAASRLTLGPGPILMVCGSAAESSSRAVRLAADQGVPLIPLPENRDDWATLIRQALSQRSSAIATIGPSRLESSPSNHVAKTIAAVLSTTTVSELLIEGGATAAAILDEMQWDRFRRCHELATGVVRMSVAGSPQHITAKPGSYPWSDEVWAALIRLSRTSGAA